MDKTAARIMAEMAEHYKQLGFFEDKRLYLAPANEYTAFMAEKMEQLGVKVLGIVDGRPQFAGMTLHGIPIGPVEDMLIPYHEDNRIFMTDPNDGRVNVKCDFLEYWYGAQRFSFFQDPRRRRTLEWKARMLRPYYRLRDRFYRSWLAQARRAWQGKRAYREKLSGCAGNIYLFPHASLGDIYILGLYRESDAKVFRGEYTLVVVKGVCQRIAAMMGFKNVVGVSPEEMAHLCLLQNLMGADFPRLSVLHYGYMHTNLDVSAWYEKGITMGTCYSNIVFGEKPKVKLTKAMRKDDGEELCRRAGIQKGKCVVLAPYAKSINALAWVFWEALAARLIDAGYQVVTNCSGKGEIPVYRTDRFDCPIEMACSAIDYAGFFVGLRSGFCDVISTTHAKKMILYPKVKWNKTWVKDHCTFDSFPAMVSYAECECPCDPKIEDIDAVMDEILDFFGAAAGEGKEKK